MRLTRCAGLRCRGDVTRDGGARACLGVARVATEAAFLPSVFGFSSGKFSHTKNPSKQPLPKKTKYAPGVWREKPTALGRKSVVSSSPGKTLWATASAPV